MEIVALEPGDGRLDGVERLFTAMYAEWEDAQKFIDKNGPTFLVDPVRDETGKLLSMKDVRQFPQVALALRLNEQLLRIEREFGLTAGARANLSVDLPSKDSETRGKSRFVVHTVGASA